MFRVKALFNRAVRFLDFHEYSVMATLDPLMPIGTDRPVVAPDGRKPRVVILADRPGWAHDASAIPISRSLSDEFEVRVEYVSRHPNLSRWPFDIIYVLFWGEEYHHKYVSDAKRVIKQISSHRWQDRFTPGQLAEKYLMDAGTLAVPSKRLQDLLAPHRQVFLAQKGFDPTVFLAGQRPKEGLRIGWVGRIDDSCKGLNDIIRPAAGDDFELRIAGGDLTRAQMAGFYNSIDVICIASTGEGDPLPLIEGMACGCFPICVDVGIVPELVQHAQNGLIVDRTEAAFREAFQWCAENVEYVRAAGLRNARDMLRTRTWEVVSAQWRTVMRHAYLRAIDLPEEDRP